MKRMFNEWTKIKVEKLPKSDSSRLYAISSVSFDSVDSFFFFFFFE